MTKGLFLISIAAILWGTVGISAKYLVNCYGVSPLTIGAWRLLLAAPILLIISHIKTNNSEPLDRKYLHLFFLYGFAVASYQVSYFAAVNYVGVSTGTLLAICTSPIFVAFLARILLKETLAFRVYIALAISILGIALIMDITNIRIILNSQYFWGYILALGAGLSYGIYAVIGKKLLSFYSPIRIISITFSLGAIFMLPFAGISAELPLKGWGILLYIGCIPTALAYIMFTVGLQKTTATRASIVTLLEPLTSTFLALMIIGESLVYLQWVGVVLLVAAFLIITIKQ